MAAGATGSITGSLTLKSSSQPPLIVALQGQRGRTAARLSWAAAASTTTTANTSAAATHDAAAVGESTAGAIVTVVNRGNAAAAPLAWTFRGDAAAEFSLDASSRCHHALVLAPGASCTLRVLFHPAQAGSRRAQLGLNSDASFDELPLQGQGLAAAHGELRATPPRLSFQAHIGQPAAAQRIWLRNLGPASLRVTALSVTGNGYALAPAEGCASDGFDLLPGEGCAVDVTWNGDAAAAGVFMASDGEAPALASVALSAREPSAQVEAVAGGGAIELPWLLALLLCVIFAAQTESRHG